MKMLTLLLCCLLLLACNISFEASSTPLPARMPETVAPIMLSPVPLLPIQDASHLTNGVCFDGLLAISGQAFTITEQSGLDALYTQFAAVCATNITRPTFDFNSNIMVIAVRTAQACDAALNPVDLTENHLMLQWSQSGTCAYDVIAIYAGALPRAYQDIQIVINGA